MLSGVLIPGTLMFLAELEGKFKNFTLDLLMLMTPMMMCAGHCVNTLSRGGPMMACDHQGGSEGGRNSFFHWKDINLFWTHGTMLPLLTSTFCWSLFLPPSNSPSLWPHFNNHRASETQHPAVSHCCKFVQPQDDLDSKNDECKRYKELKCTE